LGVEPSREAFGSEEVLRGNRRLYRAADGNELSRIQSDEGARLFRRDLNAKRSHFFEELFLEARFFVDRFLPPFFEPFFDPFFDPLRAGTFAPASRASESPIAIACFLLVTFLPERPLFKVPCLRSCIARSTFSLAFLPYLAIRNHLLDQFVFPRSSFWIAVVALDHRLVLLKGTSLCAKL
jgi:hypothetical protein